MATVPIEVAQTKLSELVQQLQLGEQMVISDGGQPLVQWTKAARTS